MGYYPGVFGVSETSEKWDFRPKKSPFLRILGRFGPVSGARDPQIRVLASFGSYRPSEWPFGPVFRPKNTIFGHILGISGPGALQKGV